MRDESADFGRRVYRRKFEIQMPVDAAGYAGRSCPECGIFFKVKAGSGRAESPRQHCPVCGYLTEQLRFLSRAQMDYARAAASRMGDMADARTVESLITGVLDARVRRGIPPGESDSILRRKVRHAPLPKFREPEVADKYMCPNCLLRYAVDTAPRICPDCGQPASPVHKVDGNETDRVDGTDGKKSGRKKAARKR